MKYLIFILLLFQTSITNGLSEKSIYGNDDRFEADAHPDSTLKTMARSVAAMVHANKLIMDTQSDWVDFKKTTLKDLINTCPGEPYENQYSLAACSGFLITPTTLLTSGHCIYNEKDCVRYKWIFDFTNTSEAFPRDNVYGCKKIIKQSFKDNTFSLKDYAVIELDRAVKDRMPLPFNKDRILNRVDQLAVIGHPVGLPLKIAGNAHKQKWSEGEKKHFLSSFFKKNWYFRANLDAFAGNSGSPVINTDTYLVEGILVSGALDYRTSTNNGEPCKESVVYPNHDSEAEEVVFIFSKLFYFQDNF